MDTWKMEVTGNGKGRQLKFVKEENGVTTTVLTELTDELTLEFLRRVQKVAKKETPADIVKKLHGLSM